MRHLLQKQSLEKETTILLKHAVEFQTIKQLQKIYNNFRGKRKKKQ